MKKETIKHACTLAIACAIAGGIGLAGGVPLGMRLVDKTTFNEKKNAISVKKIEGNDISITDYRVFDTNIKFRMKASGPGKSEAEIARPEAWQQDKNMLMAGISASYFLSSGKGSFLPGGSISYYRRIWKNIYIGPTLAIHANDSGSAAVTLYAQAGISW